MVVDFSSGDVWTRSDIDSKRPKSVNDVTACVDLENISYFMFDEKKYGGGRFCLIFI